MNSAKSVEFSFKAGGFFVCDEPIDEATWKDRELNLEESFRTAPTTPRTPTVKDKPDDDVSSIRHCIINVEEKLCSNEKRRKSKNHQHEKQEEKQECQASSNSVSNAVSEQNSSGTNEQTVQADQLASLATAFARTGDADNIRKAIRLCSEAIELNPSCAGYYGNRSLCFFKIQDYERSLTDAILALQFDPSSLKYLFRKASALFELNKLSEAEDAAEDMIKINAECGQAHEIIAKVREKIRQSVKNTPRQISVTPDSEDPIVGVIISNLPFTVKSEDVRDFVCSQKINVDHPIFFIIPKATEPQQSLTTSAVIYLTNAEEAVSTVNKLNNFPYGYNLKVTLLRKSIYKDLHLSTVPCQQPLEISMSVGPGDDGIDHNDNDNLYSGDSDLSQSLYKQMFWKVMPAPIQSDASSVKDDQASAEPSPRPSYAQAVLTKGTSNNMKKAASLFIGNVPGDTNVSDLEELIQKKVPDLEGIWQVTKNTDWNYAFVNFYCENDAVRAQKTLHKTRFNGVLLDTKQGKKVKQLLFAASGNVQDAVDSSMSAVQVTVPHEMKLHEFFVYIHRIIAEKTGEDFTIYRRSKKKCLLNMNSAKAAKQIEKLLNGLSIKSKKVKAKLTKGKLDSTCKSGLGLSFDCSLDNESTILRVDNIDGTVTNAQLQKLFKKNAFTNLKRDYPVAYFEFENANSAKKALEEHQGEFIKGVPMVICYANKKANIK